MHEVAQDVWVTTRHGFDPASRHPDDLRAGAGMPTWRAREFLAGRALLRWLLAEVAPEAAAAPVRAGRNGKPYLHGWTGVGITVAHDGDVIAAGVAPGRALGVDVQRPPEHPADGVIRRCLRGHAGELLPLPAADRAREFAWVWTAQEACVKAEGSGLSGSPWTIDIPPRQDGGVWRGFRWRSLRDLSDIPLSCAWEEPR